MHTFELLVRAIEALWQGQEPSHGRPHEAPALYRVMEVCADLFPEHVGTKGLDAKPQLEGIGWALHSFMKTIGNPWSSAGSVSELVPTPERVAEALVAAIDMPSVEVMHLCPLDQADDMPNLRFGPCQVARLSLDELNVVVQPARLRRWSRDWTFESAAFSQFTWLTVSDRWTVSKPIGTRAIPFLYQEINWDFGAIRPHTDAFPKPVEKALFALLLLPWETFVDGADVSGGRSRPLGRIQSTMTLSQDRRRHHVQKR